MNATLDIQLTRVSNASLCPYCRCEASDPVWTCPGCRIVVHEECCAELKSCPTAGCGRGFEPAPQARRGRRLESPPREGRPSFFSTGGVASRTPWLERIRRGWTDDPEWTNRVYVLTALLCLVPCSALGLQVGWDAAQTQYFGVDWPLFIKATLGITGLSLAPIYIVALPFMARLGCVWSALRR